MYVWTNEVDIVTAILKFVLVVHTFYAVKFLNSLHWAGNTNRAIDQKIIREEKQ